MSGVIGTDGVQWEHCNHCGDWVRFEDLQYGPSSKWPEYKEVNLCPTCYEKEVMTPTQWRRVMWRAKDQR